MATDAPDIVFRVRSVPTVDEHVVQRPTGRSRPVYDPPTGEVHYVIDSDELWIEYGPQFRARCDLAAGHVDVSVQTGVPVAAWVVSHPLFSLPLFELIKRRHRFSVHAVAVTINGHGVLLAGASGAGKSTLTLALIRAGLPFLGDDTLFLTPADDALRVLAFPDELDVTTDTAAFLPELSGLVAEPPPQNYPKYPLWPEVFYGAEAVWECRPTVLIFPRVAHAAHSTLTPLSPEEALVSLAPNVLLTDVPSAQAHFDVLATLARTSRCYRLDTGRDLDTVPDLLRALVSDLAPTTG